MCARGRDTDHPECLRVEVGVTLADAPLRFPEQGHMARPQPSPDPETDLDEHGAISRGTFQHSRHPWDEVRVADSEGVQLGGVEIAVESFDPSDPRGHFGQTLHGALPVIGRTAIPLGEQAVQVGERLGVTMEIGLRNLS